MHAGGTITVAGSLAQKPGHGGHAWVFLQYLLGLRRLGWNVLFLDHLPPSLAVDEAGRPCRAEQSRQARYLHGLMNKFGLGADFALLLGPDAETVGLSRRAVFERVRESAFILNVMGFLKDESVLAAANRRVFLDIDPGFGQMWQALGLADVFRGHDDFVTIGENIGLASCPIPDCGLKWVTTPQPVVLEQWPVAAGNGNGLFTTVASWRGAYGPVEYGNTTYGLRVHEFRKFMDLPRRTRHRFQLALDIHPNETRDLELLARNGWELIDPRAVAGDPWAYRKYIQTSWAEVMVAKEMYVRAMSGWLSDRSLCYLASGRPVLAQDTGFRNLYPTGAGLVPFSTPEEAAVGVKSIQSDYTRHAHAARELAEVYFNSDRVLGQLLARLGVG